MGAAVWLAEKKGLFHELTESHGFSGQGPVRRADGDVVFRKQVHKGQKGRADEAADDGQIQLVVQKELFDEFRGADAHMDFKLRVFLLETAHQIRDPVGAGIGAGADPQRPFGIRILKGRLDFIIEGDQMGGIA